VSTADFQPVGRWGKDTEGGSVAAGPRGTPRNESVSLVRGRECQSFWGRCNVFWIVLGAVGVAVAVAGGFEESQVIPSFDGLADFVAEVFYPIREYPEMVYRSS
jgi:hypothetical protein